MGTRILISVDLLDSNLYKTNPTFTSVNEVVEFTRPLKIIGLGYFTFDRHYHDNSRFSLTNSGKWIEHYWRKKLYENAIFEKDTSKFVSGHVFWNWLQREPVYSTAADYGIDHGITFIEKHDNYYDFLYFGALNNDSVDNDYLIDKLFQLNQFISIFKYKMRHLIEVAEKYKIHVPPDAHSAHAMKNNNLNDRTSNSDLRDLFSKRDVSKIYLGDDHKKTWLTRREFDMMALLTQGFSTSDAAIRLGISNNAINKYIKNIKDKLDCKTLCELGYVTGKLIAKNSHPFSFKIPD